ncbi:Rv3235 family protein [Streptomyces sp. TP-A0874]|uniref:Rv3235 family protein n=1 Tax=Streptomyces sp. TP-A0874 TaxID=549819 RepID=UPI000A41996C|nr:Rv3235 family protein [Streptomyces sp. TP-A0874]
MTGSISGGAREGTTGAGPRGLQASGRRPGRARSRPPQRRDPRGPGPARRSELDRLPRYWFANRLLLTLSGQKPVHWMLGHTLGPAYERLVELAPLRPLAAPPRSGPALPPGLRRLPVLRRCDEYRPNPGVIEAFARISAGEDRVRALAFRLEHCRDRRWRCSAVDLDAGTPGVRS